MTTAENYISHTPNKYYIGFVASIAALAALIVRKIRHVHFRTGFVTTLNKFLIKNLEKIKSLESEVFAADKNASEKDYKFVTNLINLHNQLYARLEKARFFTNRDTEKLIENSIIELYKIEGKLKQVLHKGTPVQNDDKSLQKFASALSLGSLNQD